MSLELPYSLTPSKITAFKDCPLKFRYTVIDKLPEPPSTAATKGSLVHRALELLYWMPKDQRDNAAAHACLATAREEFEPRVYELGLDEKEMNKFHDEASVLVDKYFELEDPRRIEPVGIELLVQMKVGPTTLRGIIDRLDYVDGKLRVVDYKTGRAPSVNWEQGKLGGVHFYAFMCEQIIGVRPDEVSLLYLADPIEIISRSSEQSTRGLSRKVSAIWNAIERACEKEDFRPKRSRLCNWCSFKDRCPAWADEPVE